MALRFDGDGIATGGPITLTGDFRVDLPNFTLDSIGSVQLLMGSTNGKGWVAVNASGQLFFSGQQTNQLVVPNTTFTTGVEYSGVYLERVGTTLTVGSTESGGSISVQDTGNWNLSVWGGYGDNANFREPWLATGQGVISGDGITTTTHNFNAESGSTLIDTTGSQNWPLVGFTSGGFEGSQSGSASFTSQPKSFQIFPRTTFSDGLYGKGTTSVSFTATGTGALAYRIVNEDETTEVLPTQAFTSGQEVNVTVSSDAQWYKIELFADGVSSGFSNKFGVGGVTYLSGQSLAVRMMKKAADTTTLSSMGITPSPLHSSFVSYTDSQLTNVTSSWRQFSDSSEVDSAFVEYLNKKIEIEGVVWALVGHARGGQSIDKFITGGSERPQMQTAISEVGACHEFIWFQGHSDAGTSYADYKSRLQSIYDWLQLESSTEFNTYSLAVSNKNSSNFGSISQVSEIRRAQFDFCGENNGKFVNAYDIELVADGVHQSQQGSLSLARNIFRESAGGNYGARFASFSRSGTVVSINLELNAGASTLIGVGDLSNVVSVSLSSSPYNFLTVSSVTVSASSLDVELSSDPETDDLLVWFGSTITNDGTSSIRDDYTSDGFAVGRSIARSIDYVSPDMVYLSRADYANPAPAITVTQSDNAPSVGDTVTFTASTTNANSVSWTGTGGISLNSTTGLSVTALVTSEGAYSVTATATGTGGADSDTVNGTAQAIPDNQPPTASAGPDQSVVAGATVMLDGTGSTDGDGVIVSYAWTQSAGDAVTLTGAATATPSFTAPSTNAAQALTFELTVKDDGGLTANDSVNIDVAAQAGIARPFFVNNARNFNFKDSDGIWTDKLRVTEIDSYTMTIDASWISPEEIVSYSVTPKEGLTVVAGAIQDNVIQVYLTASVVGRTSVRFDFETATRSDHVVVSLDVIS